MDLNVLWFILIAVLFTGFFFLEGFDYGVGILMPFLGRDDTDRRVLINTIGPFWDGNEVWLLTAGGAIFAAFPHWYATMFSGFYLPLLLILLALIVRAVAFEFRSKVSCTRWRTIWDWGLFAGSLIPAFLWGVAFGNLIRGVPIDASMTYVGGFWNLLNGYALVSGLTSLTVFMLHGAVFLILKTDGEIQQRAYTAARRIWWIAVVSSLLFIVLSYLSVNTFAHLGIDPGTLPIVAMLALLISYWLVGSQRSGWAFVSTSLAIVAANLAIFRLLFPNVMISSLNPDWSLTIYNASSSPYTLKVMTIVAFIFVPIVLIYQAWTYYTFRQKVTRESVLEY